MGVWGSCGTALTTVLNPLTLCGGERRCVRLCHCGPARTRSRPPSSRCHPQAPAPGPSVLRGAGCLHSTCPRQSVVRTAVATFRGLCQMYDVVRPPRPCPSQVSLPESPCAPPTRGSRNPGLSPSPEFPGLRNVVIGVTQWRPFRIGFSHLVPSLQLLEAPRPWRVAPSPSSRSPAVQQHLSLWL